jgi:hypothetical protein
MRRCRPRLAARRRFVRRSRDKASAQVSTDRMKTVLREKLGLKRNAAPSGRISYDIPHPLRTRGATLVGTWLSLVEHSLGVRGVGSSNLPVPTNSPAICFSAVGIQGPKLPTHEAPQSFAPSAQESLRGESLRRRSARQICPSRPILRYICFFTVGIQGPKLPTHEAPQSLAPSAQESLRGESLRRRSARQICPSRPIL